MSLPIRMAVDVFQRALGYHDTGRYDVIVVDAAPTGETLRLR